MDNRDDENLPSADGDIIEIEPIEDYDVHKAKLRASLLWLLHKAYGDEIPHELKGLYYETAEGSVLLLPRLANLLVSSELYCLACTSLFRDTAYQWQGHWSIIQVLSRKGIYVMETEEVAVTATVLTQTAPLRLNAHLALIDGLMTAHSGEVFTIQSVVQAVRRFTTFNASSELPSTLDDAVLFWVNMVCRRLVQRQEEERKTHEQQLVQGETTQKVRITRKHLSPKEPLAITPLKDLIQDVCDGCSLAALISFYCPQHLKLTQICLKKNLGIADSLFNLRLVRTFCSRHLPAQVFDFEYVDLLYCQESLRQNLTAFLSELFYWFEIQKLDFTTQGCRPSTASRLSSANTPPVLISEVTKRSFHKSHNDEVRSSPLDLSRVPPSPTSHLPARNVLLPKRLNEDVNSQEAAEPRPCVKSYQHSILAWQEDPSPLPEKRPGRKPAPQSAHHHRDTPILSGDGPVVSQSSAGKLLANVSIDSELLDSCRSVDLGGLGESLEIDGTATLSTSPQQQQHRRSPGQDSPMEILSISSSGTSTQMSTQMGLRSSVHSAKGDHLLPARLKAPKEKGSNHSKAEERGDNSSRKPANPVVKKTRMLPEPKQSSEFSLRLSSDSSGSSPDDVVVTPLPEEQLSPSDEPRAVPVPSHSYTIPDVANTPQAAAAAGIPVVCSSQDRSETPAVVEVHNQSRQSSIASNRSSGEFSDHESQKIHLDHKSRESAVPKEMSPLRSGQVADTRPETLHMQLGKPVSDPPLIISDQGEKGVVHTTSFAQIKKLHDFGQYDNSGYVFMQHGHEQSENGSNKMSLKAAFQRKQAEGSKPEKKTSFAALPNQTTWQQNAQRMQMAGSSDQGLENGDSAQPLASELQHVRRKLEEKRRMIEREKHRMELQKSKQRQRLGKAAFLQVLSKRDGKENSIQEHGDAQMTRSAEGRVSPPTRAFTSMSTSQPNYTETLAETNQLAGGTSRPTRTFSREDIQNTIENVRKKWFSDQNGDLSLAKAPATSQLQEQHHHKPSQEGQAAQTVTTSQNPRTTPPLDSRGLQMVTALHMRTSPPVDTKAVPPIDTRMTPPIETRATPPLDRRVTPPIDKTRVTPPIDKRTTPPIDTRTAPPIDTSPIQQEISHSRGDPQSRKTPTPPSQPAEMSGSRQKTPPVNKQSQPRSSPVIGSSPRNTPPLSKEPNRDIESYDEYNSSLDKLNHSLSELQGEIMRLSLKQEQLKKTSTDPVGPVISPAQAVTLAGGSSQGSLQSRVAPPASLWQEQAGVTSKPSSHTDSSRPPASYPSGTQTFTSPPALQPSSQHGSPAPFVIHGQPPGSFAGSTAFTSPNQYAPAGFIPPQPPFTLQSPPMYPPQLYQQSAPFPGQAGAAPFLMHMQGPSSQPYLPSAGHQYQASVPRAGYTPQPQYSTHSHPHTAPGSATAPTFQSLGEPSFPEEPVASAADAGIQNALATVCKNGHVYNAENTTPGIRDPEMAFQTPEEQVCPADDQSSAGANEGFFISFGEETPKRPKPKLGRDRNKEDSTRAVLSDRPETPAKADETINMSAGSGTPEASHNVSDANSSGIGFVIGEDNANLNKSLEDEMQKKREKMMQLQQKRREEQERKRQEKEQAEAEKREKDRRKQEEAEQRKLEERARRDAIFQKYKERKAKDDQEDPPEEVRPRKDRSRDRPRPKSMIVKTRTPIQQNGGGPVRAGNSHDDLHSSSTRDLATPSPVPSDRLPPKRGKLYRPASCHLMDTADGDPRTALPLAGNLTHRRPPSPDLYARYQNRKAMSARGADSNSETGSATGSDYAGPKLYVKPSQKSNRHIIVNAISHVCLAGTVNTDLKNRVLEEMGRSDAKHFLILFRSAGCQFRGLYTFDPETELTFKLTGAGPRQLTNKAIETFYKYNSGAKKFNIVASTKHLSVSIDAIVVHNSVWKASKQPVSKR